MIGNEKKRSFSIKGRTKGPNVAMFFLSGLPATPVMSLDKLTPFYRSHGLLVAHMEKTVISYVPNA